MSCKLAKNRNQREEHPKGPELNLDDRQNEMGMSSSLQTDQTNISARFLRRAETWPQTRAGGSRFGSNPGLVKIQLGFRVWGLQG